MADIKTLAMSAVRPAGTDGEFAPFVFYANYIVYAAPHGARTHVKLSTGDVMEVDMNLDKFLRRQQLGAPQV